MDTGQIFLLGIAVLLIWMSVMLFLAKPSWFVKLKNTLCHWHCFPTPHDLNDTEMNKKVVMEVTNPAHLLIDGKDQKIGIERLV